MNALIRPTVIIAIAFVLAVCLFGLRFAWDSAELWKFVQEDRRREQLEQFERSIYRHEEAKERLMHEAIVQQYSLSETFARLWKLDREWLQELDREWPSQSIGIAQMYREQLSDAPDYYRLITAVAARLLRDRPEEAASVLRRLEKEYQQIRANGPAFSPVPLEKAGPSR